MADETLIGVTIAGVDVSSKIAPHVLSVQVTDSMDSEAAMASIELEDAFGRTFLAEERDPVEIMLGRSDIGAGLVFEGFVTEPRFKLDADGGSLFSIQCSAVDEDTTAKEPGEKFWDDKSLDDIIQDAFSGTGISIEVDGELASIKRKFEAMDGRDPMSFATDLADEIGAIFKPIGKRGVFMPRKAGRTVSGLIMPTYTARRGGALLSCDISPVVPKPKRSQHGARTFDFAKNEWIEEFVDGVGGAAKALSSAFAADKGQAKGRAEGGATGSEKQSGQGTVTLRGTFEVQPGGKLNLPDVRPGISGTYDIEECEYDTSTPDGFVVTCQVKKPEGASDSR